MKLYTYFRSSAAYRVRIALNLKGLAVEQMPVHLIKNGGEQHSQHYHQINPHNLVPTWVEESYVLTQSLSILEYLEEKYSEIALLPEHIQQRAIIRAFCLSIACDIHPLNNLRVLNYLRDNLKIDEDQKNQWYRHWIETGFRALETQLVASNGQFCFGHQPTFADCCLIPQVYNALRFNIMLADYPKIQSIYNHCNTIKAFQDASPDMQPDAT